MPPLLYTSIVILCEKKLYYTQTNVKSTNRRSTRVKVGLNVLARRHNEKEGCSFIIVVILWLLSYFDQKFDNNYIV